MNLSLQLNHNITITLVDLVRMTMNDDMSLIED